MSLESSAKISQTPRLLISALAGGGGKTLLSLGLTKTFVQKGLAVKAFKKGPDYIDAAWLAAAANFPATNLDLFFLPSSQIQRLFTCALKFRSQPDAKLLALVEGNRGLFDGLDLQGSCSSAELARLLDLPILLTLDCTKMTRTTAAVVQGILNFEQGLNFLGLILNRVGTKRQEELLRQVLEYYTDVPLLGVLPRTSENLLPERHMGLASFGHALSLDLEARLTKISHYVQQYVDVETLLQKLESFANTHPLGSDECSDSARAELGTTLPNTALAQDLTQGLSLAQDLTKDLVPVQDLPQGLSQDLTLDLTQGLAQDLTQDLNKDLSKAKELAAKAKTTFEASQNLRSEQNLKFEANLKPNLEPNLKPNLEPNLKANLEANFETKPNLKPNLTSNLNPTSQSPSTSTSTSKSKSSSQVSYRDLASETRVTIAVAYDQALWFYYLENWQALEKEGAKLIFFSLLEDFALDAVDGLYLGGGFPEDFAKKLSLAPNIAKLKSLADQGLPIYAECGGLMVLAKSLEVDKICYPLAKVFDVEVQFCKKPQGLGYTEGEIISANPYFPLGCHIKGHEFHYSHCKLDTKPNLAMKLTKGQGLGKFGQNSYDALVTKNVWASYTHIFGPAEPIWAKNFVQLARKYHKLKASLG